MKPSKRFVECAVCIVLVVVTVSYGAAPDLVITDIWTDINLIHYQIRNIGDADCAPPHATGLWVDGQYRAKDIIDDFLKPGQRLNRVFHDDEWFCTGFKHTLEVIADKDNDVIESNESNNSLQEIWHCDQQPPTITEGPSVVGPQQGIYFISWKTDENADSTVMYSRTTGTPTVVSGTGTTQDHSVPLSNLINGAVYRFKVRSQDPSGNAVESGYYYFAAVPPQDNIAPAVSSIRPVPMVQPLFPLRFDVEATDNIEVDRVAFLLNDQLVMTAYDPPFACYLDPAAFGMSAATYFGREHTLSARAYDLRNNTAELGYVWQELPRCNEMELEIELGTSTYIYTPDESIVDYLGEIQITARQMTGLRYVEFGEGSHRRTIPMPNWANVDEVRVYYDDNLFETITPSEGQTNITCPLSIPYLAAPSIHEIKVEIVAGSCRTISRATLEVIRLYADISIERSVIQNGTAFEVSFTMTNIGTSTATLQTLTEETQGFQITAPASNYYTAAVTYDCLTSRSRIDFSFLMTILPGSSYTVGYTAIPILDESSARYHIGENNQFSYRNSFGTSYTGPTLGRVGRVDGRRIRDAVASACQESDYLIVTNPSLLFSLYASGDVDRLLTKAAELAKVRNGILAYYRGSGVMRTNYNRRDKISVGNVINDWKDEIVLMDESDDVIRIYVPGQQHTIRNVLPIPHAGLHRNDVLLVGNLLIDINPSHPQDEIAVIDGHSSGSLRGRVTVYKNRPDYDDFEQYTHFTTYDPSQGDQVIVGDMIYLVAFPHRKEIILFKGASGKVQAYYGDGGIYREFDSVYSPGDLIAAGNLIHSILGDEIVIGDVSEQRIIIYSGEGVILHQYSQSLQSGDKLLVGSDGLALASVSQNRVFIRGISEGSDWNIGEFDINLTAEDVFLCGRVIDLGVQQYLFVRASHSDHYAAGDVEIIPFSATGYAEPPGDREHLNRLLDPGGQWADTMGNNFINNGYLLIIGEIEVIPAFSCSYYLAGKGRKYIEYTDNFYGNTSGELKKPEISVGRIIGNTIDNLIAPIQTSLDVAAGVKELNFSTAYSISGGPEEMLETARHAIVVALEDKGWHVTRHDEPSVGTFYTHAENRDAIFMAAHGNWWTCWDIDNSNVKSQFNPGEKAPIVYAASCLTGRYPEGTDSLGECFLEKGASAYIGATEVSYGPYCRYLAEGFFNRLYWGTPIGSALKEAKRNRMGDGGYGKYESAIYHFFGDPKLEAVSTASSLSSNILMETMSKNESVIEGPLSTLQISIPDFTVLHTEEGDVATLPGGTVLAEPGRPEVVAWPVHIHFPAGSIVQNVTLTEISEPIFGDDLPLIEVQPLAYSEIHPGPLLNDPDAWPDRHYDWTTEAHPDGGTTLSVSIYPLRSWPASANYTFFNNCTLVIDYSTSAVTINRLWTDRKVYSLGEEVEIKLFFENATQSPSHLIAEVVLVRTGAEDEAIGLPIKHLRDVQGLAVCGWQWDCSSAEPDIYDLYVRIKSTNGQLLAQESTSVRFGTSDGIMTPLQIEPACFATGQNVILQTGFSNTGQISLSPRLIVEIQDNEGTIVERLEKSADELAANAGFPAQWEWNSTHARGECRFKAYTVYDGKTTPVLFYPELSPVADGDLNRDGIVDFKDFAEIASVWLVYHPLYDIAPDGGDCDVNLLDLGILVDAWLE